MKDSSDIDHTDPTLEAPEAPTEVEGPSSDLVGIGLAAGAGLALTVASVVGLVRGTIVPGLGVVLAVLGVGVLVAVAGIVGWSLALRPPPIKRRRSRDDGPIGIVFGCGESPQVSWVERLIELPRDDRRPMALRAPRIRRGVRWIADLLLVLEHHHGTLETIVLVMDDESYAPPIRSALDRLVRSHFDPPPGESGRTIAIEHLPIVEPDDPQEVFAAVSGKLHELAMRRRSRRRLAVAPTAGSSPTDMALTLAASTHACELIYFPGRDTDQGPERFPAVT